MNKSSVLAEASQASAVNQPVTVIADFAQVAAGLHFGAERLLLVADLSR